MADNTYLTPEEMVQGGFVQASRLTGLGASMFEPINFEGNLVAPAAYTDFISMIDQMAQRAPDPAADALGVVTKIDLGATQDGASRVYLYRGGRDGGSAGGRTNTILLTAGQHAGEPLGSLAAVSYFTWLMKSPHPLARAIRSSYRVLALPVANPWGFDKSGGGRLNSRGVNLNRTFPFYWDQYDAAGNAANFKGDAALSEAESKLIKQLFDDYNIVVLIDCHNMEQAPNGTDKNTMQFGAPSSWMHGNRTAVFGAMAAFQAATGAPVIDFAPGSTGEPTLYSWASAYIGVTKAKRNGLCAILESYADLGGGPTNARTLNLDGANIYCGALHALVCQHMMTAHRPDVPRGYDMQLIRVNLDNAVSLGSGGTLIDNDATADTGLQPIFFDGATGLTIDKSDAQNRYPLIGYRDFVRPWYGFWSIHGAVHVNNTGSASQDVRLRLQIDGTLSGNWNFRQTIPVGAQGQPIPILAFSQPTGAPDFKTLRRFAFMMGKVGTITTSNPTIQKAEFVVRWNPMEDFTAPTPFANRLA